MEFVSRASRGRSPKREPLRAARPRCAPRALSLSIGDGLVNPDGMKRGLMLQVIFLFVLLGRSIVSAQDAATNSIPRIRADQARANVGKEVIVTGIIAEVNKGERLVRLNLDKPYPNQALTAVIWADKTNLFPEIERLKGNSVEIRGKITNYRSRPEIVVSNTNQLTVVQAPLNKAAEEKK